MNGDTTVYAVERRAVNVIFENNGNELVVYSFEGDFVPNSVQGLDTIEGPFYEDGTQVGSGDKISSGISVLKLHGVFVKSEVVVNYVKYTFDATAKSYIASGKAAGFNDYYSVQGNTLVLENEVGGYPVTAIAEMAFANADGKPVRNVVVPENIVKVGKKAFLGNTDMQSVTFLAKEVTLEGSKNKNEKSYPFYGCSLSSDDEKTALKVYYNQINGGNLDWTNFRIVETSPGIVYYMYIGNDPNTAEWINYNKNGGGELRPDRWCMLTVETDGAATVEEADLDAITSKYVQSGFNADKRYTQADGDALAQQIAAELSAYRNEVGNDKYIVTVKVTAESAVNIKISVSVKINVPKQITVHSQVAMTYTVGGLSQQVNADTDTSVYTVEADDAIVMYAPVAENGYVFLGWAAERDGVMSFVGETTVNEKGVIYYAVWGFSKVGQEVKAQINYSGTAISSPESGNGKWYDGNWNEVVSVSKDNTVVYTRAKYTFSYKVSSGNVMNFHDSLSGQSKTINGLSPYNYSFETLEGQSIGVKKVEGKKVEICVDGSVKATLTLSKWAFNNMNFNNIDYLQTVSGDLSVDITY